MKRPTYNRLAERHIHQLVNSWHQVAEDVGYVTTRGATPPDPVCENCRNRLSLSHTRSVQLNWCTRIAPGFPVNMTGRCPHHQGHIR